MLTFPERFARALITQNQDACARLDRLYAIRDQIYARKSRTTTSPRAAPKRNRRPR